MAQKTVKAKQLQSGDTLMHPSVIGLVVLDVQTDGDQVYVALSSGDTLSLYSSTRVGIDR